ncbi:unnamed protein product [Macrosiphum euphorbiae]|uniref:FHA domain-containing protein n=1 Tax=Macrosiphum euphorbiae TaxID=13131 RepID=A0AAV0W283_9HEMI|nr:unnamed protein product [Macrosiphum euphorbiae]
MFTTAAADETTSISPKHAELQCHQDDQALIIRALESTGGPRTLRNCAERSSPAADGAEVRSGEMDQTVATMKSLSILW